MTDLGRAERVVAIHERQVEKIRTELAEWNSRVADLESHYMQAEGAYKKALDEPLRITNVDDLASTSTQIQVLRRFADAALVRLNQAKAHAETKLNELREAQTELRKFQMWRDHRASLEELARAQAERKLTDDLAARKIRR